MGFLGLSLHTLLYNERKRRHSIHRTPSGGTILHPHLRYKHVPSAPPPPRVAAVVAVDGRGGGPDGRISRQPRSTRVKHLKASPRPPAGHPQAWVHLGPPTTLGSSLVPRQLLTAMSLSPPPPYPPPPGKRVDSGGACNRGSGLVHVYASQPSLSGVCAGAPASKGEEAQRRHATACRSLNIKDCTQIRRAWSNHGRLVEC